MTSLTRGGAATSVLLGMAALFATISSANAQAMTMQSSVRGQNFTSSYNMEYFTHNEGGVTKIRFTLRYVNMDITNWGT